MSESITAAELRRDTALAGLEDRNGEWVESAAEAIRQHAASGREFLIEDVASTWTGPQPRDGRAWGAAARRAKRAGWIRLAGYRPANTSNRSPKCSWIAA